MKVSNIKDIEKFFEVVDSCSGKVELVTGEGDRLNCPSMYLLQTSSPAEKFRNLRSLHMRKKISTNFSAS